EFACQRVGLPVNQLFGPFANMEVSYFGVAAGQRDVLPGLQAGKARRPGSAAQHLCNAVYVQINARIAVFSKRYSLYLCLPEIELFPDENIFKSAVLNGNVIIHLVQHTLVVVIFLQANNSVPVKNPFLLRIPEAVTAMPPFHAAVVGMCV